MPDMSLSVILPALDAAHQFPASLPHLAKELALAESSVGTIELVIVDDASRDGSAGVACDHLDLFSSARLIQLPWNCGKGTAARAGVAAATGRHIAFIDDAQTADGVHLAGLVALLDEADVVLRYCPPPGPDRSLAGVGRRLTVAAYHRLARRLTDTAIADGHHHFAAIRAEVAKPLFALLQSAGFTTDVKARIVMMSMGLRIVELPTVDPATADNKGIPGHHSSPHQELVSEMVADLVGAHRHRARAQAAVRRSVAITEMTTQHPQKPHVTMSSASQANPVLVGSTAPVEDTNPNR